MDKSKEGCLDVATGHESGIQWIGGITDFQTRKGKCCDMTRCPLPLRPLVAPARVAAACRTSLLPLEWEQGTACHSAVRLTLGPSLVGIDATTNGWNRQAFLRLTILVACLEGDWQVRGSCVTDRHKQPHLLQEAGSCGALP